MEKKILHNADCTCWNCPAVDLAGHVDFRACGQSLKKFMAAGDASGAQLMAECKRQPGLGLFDPMSITFRDCPEWIESPFGYLLKNMRVMILGIDGYLGWTLALWLGKLGCKISGVDNFMRRAWLKEIGGYSIVPIERMRTRIRAAREIHGIDIEFKELDIARDREKLKRFIDQIKPEAIVHYGECPSAPYSMIDADHAIEVQRNNVLGTLGLLFLMKDLVPESSLIKLGTMGEYGAPLTGRPIFEGLFPADAVLQWNRREWSLGGELTPRDPVSFYHVSKVQDTFNVYEACKYWWLRSYDIMQGVIYGVDTAELSADPRLRTRFDIDECFGTVVNRFVSQAVVGIPLTLYGAGEQIRSLISLKDSMQCITRLIIKPPEPGQYDVVNQISGYYSMRALAQAVAKIGRRYFNLDVRIQRVENPRVETEIHPFEPVFSKLSRDFGFVQGDTLEEEIYKIFELIIAPPIKKRIEKKKDRILPRNWWSGKKQVVERLELMTEEMDDIDADKRVTVN